MRMLGLREDPMAGKWWLRNPYTSPKAGATPQGPSNWIHSLSLGGGGEGYTSLGKRGQGCKRQMGGSEVWEEEGKSLVFLIQR